MRFAALRLSIVVDAQAKRMYYAFMNNTGDAMNDVTAKTVKTKVTIPWGSRDKGAEVEIEAEGRVNLEADPYATVMVTALRGLPYHVDFAELFESQQDLVVEALLVAAKSHQMTDAAMAVVFDICARGAR